MAGRRNRFDLVSAASAASVRNGAPNISVILSLAYKNHIAKYMGGSYISFSLYKLDFAAVEINDWIL
jgi:hypothetical protein